MFFVTLQVGDITILMGNQISDFLNQPHNRTLSHRDSLLTKAVTRFMCHGRLFALCYWIQSHLWVHKLHHTFPHMFSALFWNCSFSANMLVSHLAHINFTGFMRHLALSLSSDCLCEKTTTSKSICIILMQSGPIFKHFALEVYKLARMDGWDILRKQMSKEVVDCEGEM